MELYAIKRDDWRDFASDVVDDFLNQSSIALNAVPALCSHGRPSLCRHYDDD